MILDSTGYSTIVEHRLSIAAIEFAIDQYAESRHQPSIDARLEAAERLFDATKQAWALLHATQPEIPALGPIGIV